MNGAIDRYAVFGNPIAHSKSPILHKAFAAETQQQLIYDSQCVGVDQFTDVANAFFANGGLGLNITVPFKMDAFNYAKTLTPRAKRAGAVNTLFLDHNKNIIGDNTDGVGLVNDMTHNLMWSLKDKTILIVGAGGAVRGVLEPFIEQEPKSITIVNRTLEKAVSLSQEFNDVFPIDTCSFSDLENKSFDIIINGTSASLTGDLPPLPNNIILSDAYCYDMMYSKELTPFLKWAKQNGCKKLSDGLGMLVCQGAESFFIWRKVKPYTVDVIKHVRKML
ncbi:MAG: shikimate dehydrogenase [Cellvibrionaceae bacterium]|jgi:shikimate dehydrogenase